MIYVHAVNEQPAPFQRGLTLLCLPSATQKLLKSRWQPTTPQEIARHDRRVAARRKSLGLPAPPDPPSLPPAVLDTVSRPPGPLTALLHMFTPPPPVAAEGRQKAPAVSAIYSRNEVLQLPVKDAAGGMEDEIRRLDVPVEVSKEHVTFDELKRTEKKMERRKKLEAKARLPEV